MFVAVVGKHYFVKNKMGDGIEKIPKTGIPDGVYNVYVVMSFVCYLHCIYSLKYSYFLVELKEYVSYVNEYRKNVSTNDNYCFGAKYVK